MVVWRCVLVPAPLELGVPTKARLESSIKKFNPYLVYDYLFQATTSCSASTAITHYNIAFSPYLQKWRNIWI